MDSYLDIEPRVPAHKKRSDIMTPVEATKCRKSSKAHKLKPRSCKRDATKTQVAKAFTKQCWRALDHKD
jgi:hypothetical protein